MLFKYFVAVLILSNGTWQHGGYLMEMDNQKSCRAVAELAQDNAVRINVDDEYFFYCKSIYQGK